MHLEGTGGTELDLVIVGYRFPDEERDPWDSNSLLVSVKVVAPEGVWEVVDPCLTTWEASRLAGWLGAVARSATPMASLFTAPNVTVAIRPLADGRVELRASFELELRPPWDPGAASGTLGAELTLNRPQLARAAASLATELGAYPQRGADPTL